MTNSLAMIVAASENGVIGVNDDLPWRLSADLKRFKQLTMGHPIIMGRKTFESIGRLLPGRTSVIVTRQTNYDFAGRLTEAITQQKAKIVSSIDDAISACENDELPFVTGGAEIYRQALPRVTTIHLTRVHTHVEGDTRLPEIDWSQWTLAESTQHTQDDKNEFDFTFETYQRKT